MILNIKADAESLIKGLFNHTSNKISAYIQEAKGDVDMENSYDPDAVLSRLESIQTAFEKDLKALIEKSCIS